MRAVEYLIALGHRRIALGMHNVPDFDHIERLNGYKKALADHNLPSNEKLVFRQDASHAGGASAIKMMMSMVHPPTAVYFADPLLSVGAINMAHETGIKVPEDVAIVGFDDAELRRSVYPPMTAVCQDAAGLGREAAQALTRMVTGKSGKLFQKVLPTFFEVNQTTGPPPAKPVRILPGGRHTFSVAGEAIVA